MSQLYKASDRVMGIWVDFIEADTSKEAMEIMRNSILENADKYRSRIKERMIAAGLDPKDSKYTMVVDYAVMNKNESLDKGFITDGRFNCVELPKEEK